MECTIVKVQKDYRIFLPEPYLAGTGWTLGDEPLKGWLLVAGPGRCRLLSSAEFDGDPACKSLLSAIDAEIDRPADNAVELRDAESVALGLRLIPIEISPPGPGWRLTLPKPWRRSWRFVRKRALLHYYLFGNTSKFGLSNAEGLHSRPSRRNHLSCFRRITPRTAPRYSSPAWRVAGTSGLQPARG